MKAPHAQLHVTGCHRQYTSKLRAARHSEVRRRDVTEGETTCEHSRRAPRQMEASSQRSSLKVGPRMSKTAAGAASWECGLWEGPDHTVCLAPHPKAAFTRL